MTHPHTQSAGLDTAGAIAVTRDGATATLWLNRPERRNALDLAMCVALERAVHDLQDDATVGLILVRARGGVFCAGADLHERKGMDAEAVRRRRLQAFAAYGALETCRKPCIAVIEGAVVGAGAEIATACDFIVATPAASFRYPEVAWGTVGATQRLPEIVGKRMAKELLFTGRAVAADEALHLGIVNRLVEAESLELALRELADTIIAAPASALQLVKRCVNARFDAGRQAALDVELAAIDDLLTSRDWQGRIQHFGEPTP